MSLTPTEAVRAFAEALKQKHTRDGGIPAVALPDLADKFVEQHNLGPGRYPNELDSIPNLY